MRHAFLGGLIGLILGSLAAAGIMMILFFPKFALVREQQAEAEARLAEALARAEVANNLKQLALAAHQFQDAKKDEPKKEEGPTLAQKKLEELKSSLSKDEKIVLEKAQALVEDLIKDRRQFIRDTAMEAYQNNIREALEAAPISDGVLQKLVGQHREYRIRSDKDHITVYVTDQESPRKDHPGRVVNINLSFRNTGGWIHYHVQVSATK